MEEERIDGAEQRAGDDQVPDLDPAAEDERGDDHGDHGSNQVGPEHQQPR